MMVVQQPVLISMHQLFVNGISYQQEHPGEGKRPTIVTRVLRMRGKQKLLVAAKHNCTTEFCDILPSKKHGGSVWKKTVVADCSITIHLTQACILHHRTIVRLVLHKWYCCEEDIATQHVWISPFLDMYSNEFEGLGTQHVWISPFLDKHSDKIHDESFLETCLCGCSCNCLFFLVNYCHGSCVLQQWKGSTRSSYKSHILESCSENIY